MTSDSSFSSFFNRHNSINGRLLFWLGTLVCCVVLMMVIGALTRLTQSGLSMVEWKPLTGFIPPLNHQDWMALFLKYQNFPEFQKLNSWMSLSDFKEIFWLEFIHRVWGRVIGLVFFIPFVIFWWRGYFNAYLKFHLCMILILGACQGLMGWLMVQSGLVNVPAVSAYRLAMHLMLAMMILSYLVWLMADIYRKCYQWHFAAGSTYMIVVMACLVITLTSGAFVAGLDAGFSYNTFPLMQGRWIPLGWADYQPVWKAFFEHHVTVQWTHRWLAKLTFFMIFSLWLWSRYSRAPQSIAKALTAMLIVAFVQVILGIATLLTVVSIPLAAWHQFNGALLMICGVIVLHCFLKSPSSNQVNQSDQ